MLKKLIWIEFMIVYHYITTTTNNEQHKMAHTIAFNYGWNGVNWDKTHQTTSGHLKVNVENHLTTNTDKTSAVSTLWSAMSIPDSTIGATSSVLDFKDYSVLQLLGNTTNTGEAIYIEFSTDNVTYYRSSMHTICPNVTSGDFVVDYSNIACRYIRAAKDNTSGVSETITLLAAVRKN